MIDKRFFLICCLLLPFVFESAADAQQPRKKGRRNSGEAKLAQPFVGLTADGKLVKDLYKIESTGVSTEPVVTAAAAFLAGLSEEQREKTTFPVDDLEWRKWDNRHSKPRQGVGFKEMNEEQRKLAFGLLQASLSAEGLKLSQDIMKLNHTLGELCNKPEAYGQWAYWITIMGEPSAGRSSRDVAGLHW